MRWFATAAGGATASLLPAVLLVLFCLVLPVSTAHARQEIAPTAPMVEGRVTWDERFLYVALVVDDSDILGTNTKPMSHPEQDDSVGIYLHVGKTQPDAPDAQTFAMLVSAAGGFTFLAGDPQKKELVEHPLFTIKYGVNVRGSLNRSDDRDKSFTITLAIPFEAIGIDPKTLKPGAEFGFDVVTRQRGGGLTALADEVKTEADVPVPSHWKRLVLLGPEAADPTKVDAKKYPNAILAAAVPPKVKAPQIDGSFRPEDWPATSRLTFRSADVPRPTLPVATAPLPGDAADAVAPTLRPDASLAGIGKRVLARYLLSYQADTHKAANPARGIYGPDGTLLLRDQPATGVGPWFSTDRVSWHRSQLADMRRVGVDVALVETAGPEGDTGLLDEKSLLVLLAALRGMTTDGVPTPDVAPCLDTASLVATGSPKPDLATDGGREIVYAALHHWFALVPPEYRFRITLPAAATDGRAVVAYPVFLSDGTAVINASDAGWVDDLRHRFAADFGARTAGTTLIFVGGPGFESSPGISAVLPLTRVGKGAGPLPIAVVQPGLDSPATLAPRGDGAAYRSAWEAAFNAKAAWVLLDSWNDWTRGTEVAASRQYGARYLDETRILAIASHGMVPRAVEWMGGDAPRRMRPGEVVTVTVAVRNVGTTVLRGTDGIAVAYRWRQGDKIVASGPLRLPLTTPLLPTQTARLPIGIVAARTGENGKLEPLPPGEYTLEADLVGNGASPDAPVFFSDPSGGGTGEPYRANVTLSADTPDRVEFGGTTTPTMLIGGAIYPVRVRLRWMGSEPITPETVSLAYQILTEDGKTTVMTGTAPLLKALQPGQWETLPVIFRAGDAAGPLPPACPEVRKTPTDTLGGYQIRWLLTRRESVAAVPGEYVERVAVYPSSAIAAITPASDAPKTLDADALVTFNVQVTNRGATPWKMGNFRVGCHWFFSDGLESDWKPQITTVIPRDVAPDETVTVPVTVRAPDREGAFVAAFDVLAGADTFLSAGPVSPPKDLGLLPVYVRGGRLRFVDLSHLFNVSAVAWEKKSADANFDGSGGAFPAESFPPDAIGIEAYFADNSQFKKTPPPYPSGYFAEGLSAARQISFRYGSDAEGTKDAVTCLGQILPVPASHYSGLHLAVAATGGEDRLLEMSLGYKDGTRSRAAPVAGEWLRAPGVAESVAVRTYRKRTKDGDVAAVCIVRHIILPLDVTKELVSITLPTDAHIKVFAITLEK